MIDSVIYGLCTAFLWGTCDFLSRKPSQRVGYYLTSSLMQLFSFAGLIIVSFAFNLVDLRVLFSNQLLFLINIGIGFFLFSGLVFLYRAYSIGKMTIIAPIVSSYPIVTILLSVFVLGQTLPVAPALGVLIVLTGIILTGLRFARFESSPNSRPEFVRSQIMRADRFEIDSVGNDSAFSRFAKGFGFALISCISYGVLYFGLGVITPKFGFVLPVILTRGAAALISFALLIPTRNTLRIAEPRTVAWILLISALSSAGSLSFGFGILSAGDSISIVTTLSGLFSSVTLVLAWIFYHERLGKVQIFGICILLLGATIVLYS
jgi:drug/metabolite transporter (DMT)-like permease